MPSSIRVALVVFACATLLSRPAPAIAQTSGAASLAGVVRDVSGGVLPGVTVEVASPVLIEKVRTRYGPAWLNAIQIMGGRLMKLSLQLDF